MKSANRIFVLALSVIGFNSCQKVIDVSLKNAELKYVIEAQVTDGTDPHWVTISRTKDFNQDNNFEKISGAQVVLTDLDANLSDTLKETTAGRYESSHLSGVHGHNYRMMVNIQGQNFISEARMPQQAVDIDTLYVKSSGFDENHYMIARYLDPVGVGNYYRTRQWINDTLVKGSRVRSDYALDGRVYQGLMMYDAGEGSGNPKIKPGDKIEAELQCINQAAFDYYRTIGDASGDNSTTPANPVTNLQGGALGVFNVSTSRTKVSTAVF
jgi:hypothetical protein